jgi:hypothetical protein
MKQKYYDPCCFTKVMSLELKHRNSTVLGLFRAKHILGASGFIEL